MGFLFAEIVHGVIYRSDRSPPGELLWHVPHGERGRNAREPKQAGRLRQRLVERRNRQQSPKLPPCPVEELRELLPRPRRFEAPLLPRHFQRSERVPGAP